MADIDRTRFQEAQRVYNETGELPTWAYTELQRGELDLIEPDLPTRERPEDKTIAVFGPPTK